MTSEPVLTPLSEGVREARFRVLHTTRAIDQEIAVDALIKAVEAAIRQRTIEQLRPFTTHREGCNDPRGCTCGLAAALAGVPKEAVSPDVEECDVCSDEGPRFRWYDRHGGTLALCEDCHGKSSAWLWALVPCENCHHAHGVRDGRCNFGYADNGDQCECVNFNAAGVVAAPVEDAKNGE